MLNQFLNQMDEHLSNKPFKRRWWSRRWIAHMTIQPPLTKDYPLWKRNKDELRLLRLFNLSPEELGQKIERYWKKPRWRRWFASFRMNKKIDVWNYYQLCLAYQKISQNKIPKINLVIVSDGRPISKDLTLVLHQSNIKFEAYLEKNCRNPKWIEKYLSEEINRYMQRLKKIFLTKLNKSLQQIKTERERLSIKQQAEQEYQQVEAFIFHYYHLWRFNAFSSRDNPEIRIDVVNDRGISESKEHRLTPYIGPQVFSSPSRIFQEISTQNGMGSLDLDGAKEWIQKQRHCLQSLIEKDYTWEVEKLLQSSLHKIQETIEPLLGGCEKVILDIQGKHEAYDVFLEYLNHLHYRLKPLLQGGMRLFHPDHMMSLTPSEEILKIITQYSQDFLKQSRYYLDSLKNYHLHIEELHHITQQELQRQSPLDLPNLARRIQELGQSVKDLEQSLKDLDKKLTEDTKKFWDEMYAKLRQDKAEIKAELEQDKVEIKAELEQVKVEMMAELEQDKAETDAKLKEAEIEIRTYLNAKLEQGIEKSNKNTDVTRVISGTFRM